MNIGARVLNMATGGEGHVIKDSFGCCSPNEELVVYDGTSVGLGTDRESLKVLPSIQQEPNLEWCGGGRGEDCCVFLTVSPKGFRCDRFTELRDTLIFSVKNARRNPKEAYPNCMTFK